MKETKKNIIRENKFAEDIESGAGKRILLVEYDELLMRILNKVLEEKHVVFQASSSKEALKIFAREKDKVDILLSVAVMEDGMSGFELARNMKAMNPKIKVIITSGYIFDRSDLGELNNDWYYFLPKPFSIFELLSKVAMMGSNRLKNLQFKNENVWYTHGLYFYGIGEYARAIECYNKAIEINNKEADAWIAESWKRDCLENNNYKNCNYKAVEISLKNSEVWREKGHGFYKLGKPVEAIECFRKAIEINPNDAYAWHGKGNSLAELGDQDDAIKCYDIAIEINPKSKIVWFSKGNSLAALGTHEEAIECFAKAIEINPKYAEAWYKKGRSLYRLGKNEEAVKCLIKVDEIESL